MLVQILLILIAVLSFMAPFLIWLSNEKALKNSLKNYPNQEIIITGIIEFNDHLRPYSKEHKRRINLESGLIKRAGIQKTPCRIWLNHQNQIEGEFLRE